METKYQPVKLKCRETLRRLTSEYWEKADHARDMGKHVAWCSGLVPAEFLSAMDIFTVYCMNNSATSASQGVGLDLCQIAEAEGYASDLCSYARTDIGSALAGDGTLSPLKIPKPDLLLVGNGQCHTITKWLESLGWILDVPVFLIDVPFMHDDMDKESYSRVFSYVQDQLQELISFLEKFTKRPFNHDRFQGDVANSSRMFKLWMETIDMCQNIPSPLTISDIFIHLFPVLGLRGTVEGADYYQEFKEQVEERVINKIGAIPNEKFRLHLDGLPMWFDLKGLASKFALHDASAITHPYPLVFGTFKDLDPSKPLDSMAECMLKAYVNLGIGQRIDILVEQAEKYRLDGMAMQISRSCKALGTGIYDIIEKVERRTGLPWVTFESDMCDPRFYSEAQVDTRLEAFFEILATRCHA